MAIADCRFTIEGCIHSGSAETLVKTRLKVDRANDDDTDYCGAISSTSIQSTYQNTPSGVMLALPANLYRCTGVLGVVALVCFVAPAIGGISTASGQQLLPVPSPEPDAAQSDPFTDDRPTDTSTSGHQGLDHLHGTLLRNDFSLKGAQSCAVSSCHGGPRPGIAQPTARRGSEFQLWLENDPHARSWRTFCGDESVQMMRRLRIIDQDNVVLDRAGFDNCLACHNTAKRYDEPRTTGNLREGVGCEACHGPAEQWESSHVQYNWSRESAHEQGFVNNDDLFTRARMCASCHVGDRDRDMNHDIIAAGHPTLRYELATYHSWQPKHWRDAEADNKERYEAQLWLAGQVASADASLSLLETRARRGHSASQWPEFAAYDCASCHHNLGLGNARGSELPGQRQRPATAIYSQWNDSGLRWLLKHRVTSGKATENDHRLLDALVSVQTAMEQPPRPNADSVADASKHARKELAAWFAAEGGGERQRFDSDRLGMLVASAASDPDTFLTWESAAQFYLASIAARESWPGGIDGPLRETADQLQYGLQYPQMIDISRYAKRASAKGPQLSRHEIARLSIQLARFLGPVAENAADHPPSDSRDPANVRDKLDALLERIRKQQQTERKNRGEQTPPAVKPSDNAPKEPPEKPRQSVEDLRKALESLQSDSTDDGNNQP